MINSGLEAGSIEDRVSFVFRCLNNFIIPDSNTARRFGIASVAMPLLATGYQYVPVDAMLPRLLDAAIFWLEEGLPVRELKIVAFKPSDVKIAGRIFEEVKSRERRRIPEPDQGAGSPIEMDWEARLAHEIGRQVIHAWSTHLRQRLMSVAVDDEKVLLERLFDRMEPVAPPQASGTDAGAEYDVFISYAHKQAREVAELVEALEHIVPRPRVFYDRSSIPAGGQWIKMISDAVRRARTFVAVLSPDYTASPVCWDEFQCAKLKEYNTHKPVIRTVRLYSEKEMPLIMGIYSYIDCVEGDLARLRGSAATVLGGAARGRP